jgi:hypothetical protein
LSLKKKPLGKKKGPFRCKSGSDFSFFWVAYLNLSGLAEWLSSNPSTTINQLTNQSIKQTNNLWGIILEVSCLKFSYKNKVWHISFSIICYRCHAIVV